MERTATPEPVPTGNPGSARWHEPSASVAVRLLWLVTALGAALRLYRLTAQSLWLDEVSSLRNGYVFGRRGLDALAAIDQIAPLHSVLLWYATRTGLDEPLAIRLVSVLAGLATIPVMYRVAHILFASRMVGVITAALVAVSPYSLWYSQEARMYAPLLLCTCAYVALAWPVVERALRPGELLLLTLVTVAGYGMHHYMALVAAAFGLLLLLHRQLAQPRFWSWVVTQAAAFAVFGYWLLLTADKMGGAHGSEKPAFALWVPYTLYTYVVGYSFGPALRELSLAGAQAREVLLEHLPAIAIAALATAALGLVGLRQALRREHRLAGVWLVIWLVVPIGLAVLATFLTNIRYNVRYVIVAYPALMLILALGIASLAQQAAGNRAITPSKRVGRLLAAAGCFGVVACMLVADVNHFTSPAYAKADVRSLAGFLRHLPPGDLLVSDNNRVVKILAYYRGRTPTAPLQVDYRLPDQTPDRVWTNLVGLPAAAKHDVWLIQYRSWEADPTGILQHRLDAAAPHGEVRNWPGVTLRRYGPLRMGAEAKVPTANRAPAASGAPAA